MADESADRARSDAEATTSATWEWARQAAAASAERAARALEELRGRSVAVELEAPAASTHPDGFTCTITEVLFADDAIALVINVTSSASDASERSHLPRPSHGARMFVSGPGGAADSSPCDQLVTRDDATALDGALLFPSACTRRHVAVRGSAAPHACCHRCGPLRRFAADVRGPTRWRHHHAELRIRPVGRELEPRGGAGDRRGACGLDGGPGRKAVGGSTGCVGMAATTCGHVFSLMRGRARAAVLRRWRGREWQWR